MQREKGLKNSMNIRKAQLSKSQRERIPLYIAVRKDVLLIIVLVKKMVISAVIVTAKNA